MTLPDFSFSSACKINLGLKIHDYLPTNYHQVSTVMVKIPFFDQIKIVWSKEALAENKFFCSHPTVPIDSSNLLLQAFSLLQKKFILPAAHFYLQKRIPLGSGLGGGSFNAGCLLKELNQRLNLGLTPSELMALALTLGADVPFATSDFSAVYEKNHGLKNLEQQSVFSLPACQLVLVWQDFSFSTKELYQEWQKQSSEQDMKNDLPLSALIEALKKQDLNLIFQNLQNDFSQTIFIRQPQLLKVKEKLLQAGGLGVSPTGKGPTLFALFPPNLSLNSLISEWKPQLGHLKVINFSN